MPSLNCNVPNIACAFSFRFPFLATATHKYCIGEVIAPRNSISALNKCKDTHILFIRRRRTTYALPNSSSKTETEYKPQRISNIINT